MIPETVRQELLESLPELYWVDAGHPDGELSLRPQFRWHREEFDPPSEPYESVALAFTTTTVVEDETPVDQNYGIDRFDPDDVEENHAHGAKIRGVRAYDTLELIVTAKGNATIADYQIGPKPRARALCNEVHSFLTKTWKTRPLDLFDDDGSPLEEEHPAVPDKFADELDVPLLPRMIPGRGPDDVSEEVGASGAQFNAALELAYVDTWSEYHYLAEEAPVDTVTDVEYPDAYETR